MIRNAFVDQWHGHEDDVGTRRDELVEQVRAAMRDGTFHELLVICGEVAGAIDELLPAAEIVRRMVTEAEDTIKKVARA